jgi:tetratricopeptide (TPR) repeat protein
VASDSPCPSRGELLAFANGETTAERFEILADHVERCSACLAVLESTRSDQGAAPGRSATPLPSTLFRPPRFDCPSNEPIRLPCRFGEYELLEQVGRGGMGIVYKAHQPQAERLVALKQIRGDFLDALSPTERSEAVARFRSEARAAAQLSHDNLVPVYDVGEVEGCPFYTMRFVEGHSLAAELQESPLPPQRAALCVEAVSRAVQHAHEHGLLHRDIKPRNILIDRTGRAYLTDFGLVKNLKGDGELTDTGRALGTLPYAPPEQVQDAARVEASGDVYSLGATLDALLTGRPPFQAAGAAELLDQLRTCDPVPPRQLNPAIPHDLETIALKCLEKVPGRRYASAGKLADDLGRFLKGEPIEARPVSPVEHAWRWCRRHSALAFSGSVAVAALLAVTIVALLSARSQAALNEQLTIRDNNLTRERDQVKELNATSGQLSRATSDLLGYLVLAEVSEKPESLSPTERQRFETLKKLVSAKRLPEILDTLDHALTRLNDLDPADPEVIRQRQLVANVYPTLATKLKDQGRREEAARLLRGAQRVWEERLRNNPDDADAANELANGHYSLGALARDAGNLEEMQKEWEQAAEISKRIASRDVEYAVNLGRTYYNLGVGAAEARKLDLVVEWQTRAIDVLEPICQREPSRKDWSWFLCWAHVGRGLAWRDQKNPPKALPDLERAAELAEEEDGLRIRLEGVALARVDLGDHARAAADADAVVQARPKNAEFLHAAAGVHGRCAGAAVGAAALSEPERMALRDRYRDRAIELLRQAKAAGAYRTEKARKELREDASFAALRGDATFEAVVRELTSMP